MKSSSVLLLGLLLGSQASAEPFRPPAFIGGIPGRAQMQAVAMQRHQARTLLYREALEELRRNPRIVDVRECREADTDDTFCLPKPPPLGVPAAIASKPTERRIALLIANNRYRVPIPSLETPRHDVERIAASLERRLGFELQILNDATKADIVRAIARLAREMTPADSLFVYYAGHGYQMDDTEMGYWIPVDGSVKTAAQWISNTDISKLLRAIPARQVMLVSDSCFSGTLTREQTQKDGGSTLDVLRKRSVLVLSSGGEEPVSDEGKDGHSIFAWHFLRSIQQLDETTKGFTLYRDVREGVSEDYPQTPQYGAVISAGHEAGGEYLFEVSQN